MCKKMRTKGKQNDEEGASKYQIHVITREMNTKSGLKKEREREPKLVSFCSHQKRVSFNSIQDT